MMGRWAWIACVVVAAAVRTTDAKFMMPTEVPVDRLERNVAAYVKAHPEEAEGYYTLGRVHYLAVAKRTGTVGVYEQRGNTKKVTLPKIAADMFQGDLSGTGKGQVTTGELAGHVRGAVENFRTAIALEPKNGLYHLTLASVMEATPGDVAVELGGFPPKDAAMMEQLPAEQAAQAREQITRLADEDAGARDAAMGELRKLGAPAVAAVMSMKDAEANPEVRARRAAVVKGYWEDRAAEEYAKAYELAITKDKTIQFQPFRGIGDLVSYEAGARYAALTERRPRTEAEVARVKEMREGMKELEGKPPGPITPVVFAVDGAAALSELVDERARVGFDLDGTARGWKWPWVRPATGILVWDPSHTGRIESGRQLFGNVTFGLFWRNGYRAMAALDDDGDGELAGRELDGLAVWFDRNGDGASQRGEVVRIQDVGVAGLSVRATGVDGVSPWNARGMRMCDGRVLATYDWVASPVGR